MDRSWSLLLFLCFLFSSFPSSLACVYDCSFFGDVNPLNGTLAIGASVQYPVSLSIDGHFSLFAVNYYSSSTRIRVYGPSVNGSAWALDGRRYAGGYSAIIIHGGLAGIRSACPISPCTFTVELSNFGSSSLPYLLYPSYDAPGQTKYNQLIYGQSMMGAVYARQWKYYGVLIAASDLDVLLRVLPDATPGVALEIYLANDGAPLEYIFPTARNPGQRLVNINPLNLVINSDGTSGPVEGYYLIGVYASPNTVTPFSSYAIVASQHYGGGGATANLSMVGLIAALAVFSLFLVTVAAFFARRRRQSAVRVLALDRDMIQQIRMEMAQLSRPVMINSFIITLAVNDQRLVQQPAAAPPPPAGAPQAAIDGLRVSPFKWDRALDAERPVCAIDLGELEDGEPIKTLPCGHYFRVKNIDTWLHNNNSCPVCRRGLT